MFLQVTDGQSNLQWRVKINVDTNANTAGIVKKASPSDHRPVILEITGANHAPSAPPPISIAE